MWKYLTLAAIVVSPFVAEGFLNKANAQGFMTDQHDQARRDRELGLVPSLSEYYAAMPLCIGHFNYQVVDVQYENQIYRFSVLDHNGVITGFRMDNMLNCFKEN